MIVAAANAKVFWYLTRGTGVVALLLLTASVALGVLSTLRWRSGRWPRFMVAGLHRNLTLLAIVFVVVHVATTVLDGYAPVKLQDAVVPLISRYRPVWLGLGAVAFDLLLALVITSLLRAKIGNRLWRGFHWLAYASWPIALTHSLGTGSDARIGWMLAVGVAAVAVVLLAVTARILIGSGPRPLRLGAAASALLVPLVIGVWYQSGPARVGWAKRAGTPTTLVAHTVPVSLPRQATSTALPRTSFTSSLSGTIKESNSAGGLVTVVISGRLSGGPAGFVRLDLRGVPQGGGVSMTASGVSYVPAGTQVVYTGSVTSLADRQVVAAVATPAGARLTLSFVLAIDAAGETVTGEVDGSPA